MKRLVLKPHGWPCCLVKCPPGLFLSGESVGLKSEYRESNGQIEAYNECGEFFWGGAKTEAERRALIVQPLEYEWEDVEIG